jgi:hypothetical protein
MSTFAYVQARLQARYGERIDDATWSRLEALPNNFPLFLKQTRETSMAPWVSAIDDETDIHSLESRLEEFFLNFLQDVASWVPMGWRPAVSLSQNLFHLPSNTIKQKKPAAQQESLEEWLEEWRALWPKTKSGHNQLEELIRLVQNHSEKFNSLENSEQASAARQELTCALELRFRRFAVTPAALFVFILLLALDYERLRGGLSRRLLFVASGKGDGR